MSDPFIGEIMVVGFNFNPRGWAKCEGQLLNISGNPALFSLLGTTFGGDGRTTFGLPDLRGRSMVGVGSGPGLTPITWGERSGRENVVLAEANLPSHTHTLHGELAPADKVNPQNRLLAGANVYADSDANGANNRTMSAESIGNTGGGQQFDVRSPYLGLCINIALVGVFPSRS